MRIFSAESLRFPGPGLSSQGKAGPKPRATAVGDGKPVHIPALGYLVRANGVTQEGMRTRCWFTGAKDVRVAIGKSVAYEAPRSDSEALMAEVANPTLPGKASSER